MSRGFKVNFSCPELKNALRNIDKYDNQTTVKIENAISKSTLAIGKGAKERVPVRTGDLKKSIKSSFHVKAMQGTVKAKQYYAHLIEFGAKVHDVGPPFMRAWTTERPFLRPSFEQEKPNLIKNVKDAIKP